MIIFSLFLQIMFQFLIMTFTNELFSDYGSLFLQNLQYAKNIRQIFGISQKMIDTIFPNFLKYFVT